MHGSVETCARVTQAQKRIKGKEAPSPGGAGGRVGKSSGCRHRAQEGKSQDAQAAPLTA
jgi:hypothetical protein